MSPLLVHFKDTCILAQIGYLEKTVKTLNSCTFLCTSLEILHLRIKVSHLLSCSSDVSIQATLH
jgi:hypothetical protein